MIYFTFLILRIYDTLGIHTGEGSLLPRDRLAFCKNISARGGHYGPMNDVMPCCEEDYSARGGHYGPHE